MRVFNNYDLHFNFGRKNDSICFLNADYIHPLKQDLVQELQVDFERNQNVKAVIVFGSSVEFRCNSYSDLDLCVQRYDSQKSFHPFSETDMSLCRDSASERTDNREESLVLNSAEEIDLVYWDRIGERLKNEIALKGIVVFDREEIYV
ncbi:MAG: nucleotidyltransferase domain-containing protein [Lachnospiraceae bacterium]|nr:nucleotidyltransferase domain-containing protein [Lachnospiraceae bacterium]